MVINNFDNLIDFISIKNMSEDNFFFLTVVKRRKDNPGMKQGEINIDNFFINDIEHLLKLKDRIVDICNQNNARAYFYINKRSKKRVALETLKTIVNSITSENYEIKNSYQSNCGKHHSDDDKHWILDVDVVDIENFNDVTTIYDELIPFVKSLQNFPSNQRVPTVIKTKNGYHIICKPFKMNQFKEKYPKISVHKDPPTLLYMP